MTSNVEVASHFWPEYTFGVIALPVVNINTHI